MRTATILKAIGEPKLTLHDGGGYWYFVYDDVERNIHETLSVPVFRLNHMALASWVEEGKQLIQNVNDLYN